MREHMVATILAMVIAFIVCWTPLLVWNLLTTVSYWKVRVFVCLCVCVFVSLCVCVLVCAPVKK